MVYNAGKTLTKLCVEKKNYITGGLVKGNSYPNQIIHTPPLPPTSKVKCSALYEMTAGFKLFTKESDFGSSLG